MQTMQCVVLLICLSACFLSHAWHMQGRSLQRLSSAVPSSTFVLRAGKMTKTATDKLRVKLLADVKDTGKKGEIVMVNPALFINVLQAKKLAVKISDEQLVQLQEDERKRLKELYDKASAYSLQLKTISLVIAKKVGANKQIFGTVNHKHVLEEVKKAAPAPSFDWQAKNVGIVDLFENIGDGKKGAVVNEIRKAGEYVASVKVHVDLPAIDIPLSIVPET